MFTVVIQQIQGRVKKNVYRIFYRFYLLLQVIKE